MEVFNALPVPRDPMSCFVLDPPRRRDAREEDEEPASVFRVARISALGIEDIVGVRRATNGSICGLSVRYPVVGRRASRLGGGCEVAADDIERQERATSIIQCLHRY